MQQPVWGNALAILSDTVDCCYPTLAYRCWLSTFCSHIGSSFYFTSCCMHAHNITARGARNPRAPFVCHEKHTPRFQAPYMQRDLSQGSRNSTSSSTSSATMGSTSNSSSASTSGVSTSSGMAQTSDLQPSTSGRPFSADTADTSTLLTLEELQDIAAARGFNLSLKTLGPFYRITCRDGKHQQRQGAASLAHQTCISSSSPS